MRVYVAGPMAGFPEHNFPLFREVTERLRKKGFHVVSPVEIGESWVGSAIGYPPQAYLIEDIKELLTCDAIAVLPGWHDSCGATCEVVIARTLGFLLLDWHGLSMEWPTGIMCTRSYPPRK